MLVPLALGAIEPLLLAYWVLATASVIVTVLPFPAPQAFKDAVVLSASRGKLWDDRPRGAALPAWLRALSVPQRRFLHFYAAGALCNALALAGAAALFLVAVAAPPAAAPCSPADRSSSSLTSSCTLPPPPLSSSRPPILAVPDAEALAALFLFQGHLLRRLAETALLFKYPPGARMHAIAYAFGLSYYVVAPLSLLPRGWSGRALAAWERGGRHGVAAAARAAAGGGGGGGMGAAAVVAARAVRETLSSSDAWRMHLVGVLLFLAANALQLASHAALARLAAQAQRQQQQKHEEQGEPVAAAAAAAAMPRAPSVQLRATPARGRRRADGREGGKGEERLPPPQAPPPPYLLPPQGSPLFALVSCPHYSAEVLLYAALALLTRLRQPLPLLMAAWVAFNLALAARATHAWYARRFGAAYERIEGWGRGGREGDGGRPAPWWRRRRALVPFVF